MLIPTADKRQIMRAGFEALSSLSSAVVDKICKVKIPSSDTMVSFKLARQFTITPDSLISDGYKVVVDEKYKDNKKVQKAIVGASAIVLLLLGLNMLGGQADTKSAQSLIDDPVAWLPAVLSKTGNAARNGFSFMTDALCALLQCTVTVTHFVVTTMIDIVVALTHLVCMVAGLAINLLSAVVKIVMINAAVAKWALVITLVTALVIFDFLLVRSTVDKYLRVNQYTARNFKRLLTFATQLSDVACMDRDKAWQDDAMITLSGDNVAYGDLNVALDSIEEVSEWYRQHFNRSFGHRHQKDIRPIDDIITQDEKIEFNYVVALLNSVSIVLQHYAWHFSHLHHTTPQMDDAIRYCLAVESEILGLDFVKWERTRQRIAMRSASAFGGSDASALQSMNDWYELTSCSL